MPAALADISAFLILTAELATGAIGFSVSAFVRAATSAEAQSIAILIAFTAGVSEMLGQSVILVVNRVPLYRFLASLAFTGATYALTVVTWGLAALLVAPLTRMGALTLADLGPVIGVLALAFAPRLFGVFAITPYFGAALGNIFEVWSMALAMFGLHVAFDMPIGAAVFAGGAGFLVSFAFRAFMGRLLAKPLGSLRQAISGSSLEKSPQQIIDDIITRLKQEGQP